MFYRKEYKEHMRFLIEKAYEEYKTVSYGIPGRQLATLKTYLWLGSIVGAFEVGLFSSILTDGLGISFLSAPPDGYFYGFAFFALLFSLAAFSIAIDAMRERELQALPFGDFMKWENIVREDAQEEDAFSFQPSILNVLNEVIRVQSNACDRRGKTLKRLSTLQLASLTMVIGAVLSLISVP